MAPNTLNLEKGAKNFFCQIFCKNESSKGFWELKRSTFSQNSKIASPEKKPSARANLYAQILGVYTIMRKTVKIRAEIDLEKQENDATENVTGNE